MNHRTVTKPYTKITYKQFGGNHKITLYSAFSPQDNIAEVQHSLWRDVQKTIRHGHIVTNVAIVEEKKVANRSS